VSFLIRSSQLRSFIFIALVQCRQLTARKLNFYTGKTEYFGPNRNASDVLKISSEVSRGVDYFECGFYGLRSPFPYRNGTSVLHSYSQILPISALIYHAHSQASWSVAVACQ